MKSPLLVILSHSGANAVVARHWPFYLKGECDILGVGREDTACVWPSERLIGCIAVGKESYVMGTNHLERFLSVLRHCIFETAYPSFCLIEYDCLLFKPLTPPPAHTLVTTIAGGRSPGFRGSRFFHSPWLMDRGMAVHILDYGRRLLNADLIEAGFIDRWLGLLSDLFDLRVLNSGWYSQNSIDRPEYVKAAQQAIKMGVGGAHGVKTAEVLEQLKYKFPDGSF